MGRKGNGAPKVWRVGLYIRLSREDGRVESLSVTNQRKILRDFLEGEFEGAWEDCREYIDEAAIIGLN